MPFFVYILHFSIISRIISIEKIEENMYSIYEIIHKEEFIVKAKNITAWILAMLMLASCGEASISSNEDTKAPESQITEDTTAAETRLALNLPEVTFDGADFTHLATGTTSSTPYYVYYAADDLYAEGEIGEPINDAIYRRNRAVEEKYDVTIKIIAEEETTSRMQQAFRSDDCPYDVVWNYTTRFASNLTSGWFTDLTTVPYLDLSQPWWDQNIQKDLTLSDKVYLLTGGISILDDECAFSLFFNKYLVNENHLTSPYELVTSGKWTLNEFSNMVKAVSSDLDGSGEMEEWIDRYGLLTDSEQINRLFLGIGGQFYEGNAEDGYRISITDEKNFQRMSDLKELLGNDRYCAMLSTNWGISTDNIFYWSRAVGFGNDHYLFYASGVGTAVELRDMEHEFGILPIPKYDEQQSRYYAPVDYNAPVLALMINTPDLEKSAIILEALSYEGMYTSEVAFTESSLERKYTRDEESLEMIKIISESRCYDMYTICNWGDLYSISVNAHGKGTDLRISNYEKSLNTAQKKLDKEYEKFMAIE